MCGVTLWLGATPWCTVRAGRRGACLHVCAANLLEVVGAWLRDNVCMYVCATSSVSGGGGHTCREALALSQAEQEATQPNDTAHTRTGRHTPVGWLRKPAELVERCIALQRARIALMSTHVLWTRA